LRKYGSRGKVLGQLENIIDPLEPKSRHPVKELDLVLGTLTGVFAERTSYAFGLRDPHPYAAFAAVMTPDDDRQIRQFAPLSTGPAVRRIPRHPRMLVHPD